MSDKTEESETIEEASGDLLIRKKNNSKEQEDSNSVELFLGCIFVSVAIILTIFSYILIQVFEVVPTNIVLVKSVIQVILFTISNKSNGISILLENKSETTVLTVQGLLSGLAFICSVGAVRLLPLGDFLSITFSQSVFLMLLMSGLRVITDRVKYKITVSLPGLAMTKKKISLTLTCMLGLVLLIKTKTRCINHPDGLIDVVYPLQDPSSSIWLGLGLAFLYNAFSSQAEVIVFCTQSAPGVVSFWSGVGGLVTAALSLFFSAEPSLLSGSMPLPMQVFLLLSLSISAIATAILTDQAEKLVNKTFVKTIRSLEIPLGLLVSLSLTNDYCPSYVGYIGVVLIVTSSVVTQATIEDEDRKNKANDLYETV